MEWTGGTKRRQMDNIIHFIKHLLGLCGEPHPSLLMGGFGILGYCLYCIRELKNKWRKK